MAGLAIGMKQLKPLHVGAPHINPSACLRPQLVQPRSRVLCSSSSAAVGSGESTPEQPQYTPFPRLREGDPYRLLGLSKEAGYDEVSNARNFLQAEYKWHEPSREAIELAYESIMQEKLKHRQKSGFQGGPLGLGARRNTESSSVNPSLARRIGNLFDPTITIRTLINEGLVYVCLAFWCLFSTDPSFPLAGAFAYSVYKFQDKRVRVNPEGPFFGGNPILGAFLSTVANLALGCALMAVLNVPLSGVLEHNMRQVGGFVVVSLIGVLGVYLK